MGLPLFGTPADAALRAKESGKPLEEKTEKPKRATPPPATATINSDSGRLHISVYPRDFTPAEQEERQRAARVRRAAEPILRSRLRLLAQAHANMTGSQVSELDVYETLYGAVRSGRAAPRDLQARTIVDGPVDVFQRAREAGTSAPSTAESGSASDTLSPRVRAARDMRDAYYPSQSPSAGTAAAATTPATPALAPSTSTSEVEPGPSRTSSSAAAASSSVPSSSSAPAASSSGMSSEGRRPFTGSITANGAGANTGAGVTRPKTEAELEADRRYEEQIEEQYARMEGGA